MPAASKRHKTCTEESLIDLSDRPELGTLTQLVAAIRSAEPARELLLVGATARDLHLWHVHKIAIERATFDLAR